jgi:hypothetical protein
MANVRINKDKKQTKRLSMRVGVDEYVRIKEMVDISGVTVSEMLRAAIYGRSVKSRINATAVCELRRQGVLLREALADHRVSDEVKHTLREIIPMVIDAIKKVSN